ncbi:MAG: CCA tRNA nucleotidyltransferase, partial [Thermoplasmataceae archaeon]
METLNSILSRYTPDQDEQLKLKEIADSIINSIRAYCKINSIQASPVLVGSVAKGTNLRGADIDIFIVFERIYSENEMERLGLEIGRSVLPGGEEKYAEHPYISGVMGGIKLDIVPCFRIEPNKRIISSVDRTPLHTEYVARNLSDQGRNEVRLLKLFMKHFGIYGSEIKTGGFSGYVCELLVIKFGSFKNVIANIAGLKRFRLEINDHEMKYDPRFPVVIQDPTDYSRNAAAAVSPESFAKLILASKIFVESGNVEMFIPKPPISPEPIRPNGNFFRIVEIPRPDLVDDIV